MPKHQKKETMATKDLTLLSFMAALLSISSYLVIPLPFSVVGITAQSFVINMIALLFPPKKAGAAVFIWILAGALGMPVFSGGMGGIAKLFGPSGGYLAGYAIAAVLISFFKGAERKKLRYCVVTIGIGLPVIYLCGGLWYCISTGIGDWRVAVTALVLPFLPLDIVKCVAASVLSAKLTKRLFS